MISGRQPLSLLQPDMGSYGVTFLCSTALSLHRESTAHLPDGGLKESYLAPWWHSYERIDASPHDSRA
jgi:hypothetical protein